MIKNLKTGSANTGKKLMKKSGKLHRLDCDTSLIVKNIEKKSYNISIIENYGVLSLPLSHRSRCVVVYSPPLIFAMPRPLTVE